MYMHELKYELRRVLCTRLYFTMETQLVACRRVDGKQSYKSRSKSRYLRMSGVFSLESFVALMACVKEPQHASEQHRPSEDMRPRRVAPAPNSPGAASGSVMTRNGVAQPQKRFNRTICAAAQSRRELA